MGTAESYRKIASELWAQARNATTDAAASRIDALAQCYLRLAEQADQNSRLSAVRARRNGPLRSEHVPSPDVQRLPPNAEVPYLCLMITHFRWRFGCEIN